MGLETRPGREKTVLCGILRRGGRGIPDQTVHTAGCHASILTSELDNSFLVFVISFTFCSQIICFLSLIVFSYFLYYLVKFLYVLVHCLSSTLCCVWVAYVLYICLRRHFNKQTPGKKGVSTAQARTHTHWHPWAVMRNCAIVNNVKVDEMYFYCKKQSKKGKTR